MRLATRLGRAIRAIGGLLKRGDPVSHRGRMRIKRGGLWLVVSTDYYLGGQWHRWYAANARNRRQIKAWKRCGAGRRIRLDPRKLDLPRWSVP